jgi:outer membrane protein OmpA-like peptidoglycan-associated protein
MSTTNASNGWRWVGTAILLLTLLLLWIVGLGPAQPGCCGITVAEKPSVPPVSVAPSPVNITFKNEAGKIVLSGELPTEAEKHNAVNAATALFGAEKVIDKLTVWKDSSLPGWWPYLDKVLSWVKSGPDFGIAQADKKITLTGTVPTDTDKSAKEAGINALLGEGHLLDNQMFAAHITAPVIAPPVSVSPPAPAPKLEPEPKPEPEAKQELDIPACSKDMNVAISFKLNSATLSAKGKQQLDQIVDCITTPTQVAGHTDNTGEASYNKMLSKARAKAVIDYITTIKPDKGNLLKSVGFGENKPIANNATREGRAKNRRIEFMAK